MKLRLASVAVLPLVTGCWYGSVIENDVDTRSEQEQAGLVDIVQETMEDNSGFETLQEVNFKDKDLDVFGNISQPSEIDVYKIKIPEKNNHRRMLFDVSGSIGFEPKIALFTHEEDILMIGQEYAGFARAFVSHGEEGFAGYAAICDRDSDHVGSYNLHIWDIEENDDLKLGQIIYLQFSEKSMAMREMVIANLESYFAGYNIKFTGEEPQDDPYSVVHIGGSGGGLRFGLADNTDSNNVNKSDRASVYANELSSLLFIETLNDEAVAQAIATVTAHEVGHLVGLYHVVSGAKDFMDSSMYDGTGKLSKLTDPRSFGRHPLNPDKFPIGYQDAHDILKRNVGINE